LVDGSAALDAMDLDLFQVISGKSCITVINKSDLPQALNEHELPSETGIVRISCKSGSGIDLLRYSIYHAFISEQVLTSRDHVAVTSLRHRDILQRALDGLDQFCSQQALSGASELLAIDLRYSLSALGEITGETTPDAILDLIFSSFCIGK
jgi:tRNA modification GTPase